MLVKIPHLLNYIIFRLVKGLMVGCSLACGQASSLWSSFIDGRKANEDPLSNLTLHNLAQPSTQTLC